MKFASKFLALVTFIGVALLALPAYAQGGRGGGGDGSGGGGGGGRNNPNRPEMTVEVPADGEAVTFDVMVGGQIQTITIEPGATAVVPYGARNVMLTTGAQVTVSRVVPGSGGNTRTATTYTMPATATLGGQVNAINVVRKMTQASGGQAPPVTKIATITKTTDVATGDVTTTTEVKDPTTDAVVETIVAKTVASTGETTTTTTDAATNTTTTTTSTTTSTETQTDTGTVVTETTTTTDASTGTTTTTTTNTTTTTTGSGTTTTINTGAISTASGTDSNTP